MRSQKAVSEKEQIGRCFGLDFFLFPSPPPSSLHGKMKRFIAQIESKDAAHPVDRETVRPTESDLLSPTHPLLPTLPRSHKFRRSYGNRHTFFWTAGNNRCLYLNHFFFFKKFRQFNCFHRMSGIQLVFWFRLFRKIVRKIVII